MAIEGQQKIRPAKWWPGKELRKGTKIGGEGEGETNNEKNDSSPCLSSSSSNAGAEVCAFQRQHGFVLLGPGGGLGI